jgi:hypothetical protein
MNEVKVEDNGSKDVDVAREVGAGKQLDPEIDQAEVGRRLQNAFLKKVADNPKTLADCLLANVEKGHLPSAQMLLDIAFKPRAYGTSAEKLPPSFAAELWQMSREVLAEAGM